MENHIILSQMKVLYTEDDDLTRHKVSRSLKRRCKEVYEAENGKKGLELYKQFMPDIVVTDISMPEMDGVQLITEIKKINSDTPVIVTTAFNETSQLIQLISLNIDEYLHKPIKANELITALEKRASYLMQTESVRKLSQAVEQSPASVVITDRKGKIEYVNTKFTKSTGYSLEEAIGKNPRILKSGVQGREFYKDLWVTITSGKEWQGEFHNKKKNGELFWEYATIAPVKDKKGAITHFIALKEDITMRKEVEERLEKSESQFRSVAESAKDGIVLTNSEGKIIYHNREAEEIFGYGNEELLNRQVTTLMPERFRESHVKVFENLKNAELSELTEGKTVEVIGLRKNGTEMELEISLSHWETGGMRFFSGIIRDITERKELERQLHEARERAEEATRAKSDFLAKMSHEIRTPMNGIIGTTDLVLQTELTEQQREYIEMTKLSANNLLTIINDILDFSKIEAGKMDLEDVDFDLIYTVEGVCETFVVSAGKKGINLYTHIRPSIPIMVKGDQVRLRQILTNLVGNAMKFTEKGEIVILAEHGVEEGGKERIDIGKESHFLHFSVTDTGTGIPEERLDRIFESFSQADGTIARKFGGTGLGLTISRQLVSMMKGEMWVESDEGLGSTFHFTVRPGVADEGTEHPLLMEGIKSDDTNILIVESDMTSRLVLKDILEEWRFTHREALSGREGLRAMIEATKKNTPFQIVLVSSHLPDMDGYEFASKAKSNTKTGEAKLILLAGFKEGEELIKSGRVLDDIGLSGYLMKPYKQAKVLSLITGKKLEQLVDGALDMYETLKSPDYSVQILLAEDNPVNQAVATGVLENLGHKVVIAENGKEVIEKLRIEKPDMIFMDIEMPEMDGIEATKVIRATKDAPFDTDIPIVAMTAHAMQSDKERCIDAGMNDYISKPFKPNEISDIIRKFAPSGKRLDAELSEPEPRVTDTSTEEHVVDWKVALEALGGDEKLLKRIAGVYYDDMPKQLRKLKEALEEEDAVVVRRQAHSIKGASSNIKAGFVQEVARKIEKAAGGGDLETSRELIPTLECEFERVHKTLEGFLS